MADSFKIPITLSLEMHFLCFSEFYTKVCKPMVIRKLIEQSLCSNDCASLISK